MSNLNITSVAYRRLKNLGNYENECVEAEAQVAPDDDPKAVYVALVAWVEEQIDPLKKVTSLERELGNLKAQVARTKASLAEAAKRWSLARDILDAHGIKTADIAPFFPSVENDDEPDPEPEAAEAKDEERVPF